MDINSNTARNAAQSNIENSFQQYHQQLEQLSQPYAQSEQRLESAASSGDQIALAQARLDHQKNQLQLQTITEIMQSKIQQMMQIIRNLAVR